MPEVSREDLDRLTALQAGVVWYHGFLDVHYKNSVPDLCAACNRVAAAAQYDADLIRRRADSRIIQDLSVSVSDQLRSGDGPK